MSAQTTAVKAWLFTTTSYPQTLYQSTTHPIPSTPPTPTSVIIKPHAVSLNPVDIQLMNLPFNNLPASTPFFGGFAGPKIPGRDFSGTILAAGPSTTFRPGDEVMGINMAMPGTGFLAEAVALDTNPASGANLIVKPSHLTHVQAASLPCVFLTAKTSIDRCKPYLTDPTPANNRLVVLGGSSSTGIYTIKLAKQAGWTVLSSCSSRNTEFVQTLGADETVDYTSSPTAVTTAVRAFRPSAIIDCVGGVDTIGLAPQYVTIVGDKTSRDLLGGPALYWTRPRMLARWLWGCLRLGHGYECVQLSNRPDWLRDVATLKSEDVVVDAVFAFDHVKAAFERLDTGRARGKVVVCLVDEY